MKSVVFVCLGNICRSPMAELMFKKMLAERDLAGEFYISSRATSSCEEGNGIYPPARRTLAAHGIEGSHRSTPLEKSDVINADYILVMDSENLFDVLRITGGKYGEKIFKLLSFAGENRDVADPWYTRDFEKTYTDLQAGLTGFLKYLGY